MKKRKQKKKMEDQGIQKIPLWDKIFSKIAKNKNKKAILATTVVLY